ncbi:MAG: hypothetical protein H5U37_03340 [Caldisericia bacterium]|nr:hypothetical protein [Caldisericia bacterium]
MSEFIKDLIEESFLNKLFNFLSNLYNESFISKIFNSIKELYFESYIFKILKREDENLEIPLKIFKIKYEGNFKFFLIFLIIFSIPYILRIPSLFIKISILIILFLIFLILLTKENLIKESYLFKIIKGEG